MFKGYKGFKPWWFDKDIQQINKNLQTRDLNDRLDSSLDNNSKSTRIKL